MSGPPDIPVHLTGRPVHGGLVVPWITASACGIPLFGTISDQARHACVTGRRCQICGHPLPGRAVLFARETDLQYRCTVEPATCPPCAHYSTNACPMLAGRRSHYRASGHRALAGIAPAADTHLRQAAPAQRWHAVWVNGYDVISHPATGGITAASWARIPPLTIRPLPATS